MSRRNLPSNRKHKLPDEIAEAKRRKAVETYLKDVNHVDSSYPIQVCSFLLRLCLIIPGNVHTMMFNRIYTQDCSTTCIVCKQEKDADGKELVSCHGKQNGQLEKGELVSKDKKLPCRSMFHLSCIAKTNYADYFFQYSARPENQDSFLCPLHFCACCNRNLYRQSAYLGDMVECVNCFTAFHPQCYPVGGVTCNIEIKDLDQQTRVYNMIMCPNHRILDRERTTLRGHTCSNLICKRKYDTLSKCSTCPRSFHPVCQTVKFIDGQPADVKRCTHCLTFSTIPIGTPVITRIETRTILGLTVLDDTPLTILKLFNAPACIKNLLTGELHYVDSRNIVELSAFSSMRFSEELQAIWKDTEKMHMENEKKRTPQNLKLVNRFTNVNIGSRKRKPTPYSLEPCGCKGFNRCRDDTCNFVQESRQCPPECNDSPYGKCNNQGFSLEILESQMELRVTPSKGYGMFCIPGLGYERGVPLTEYAGEVIGVVEALKRRNIVLRARDKQGNLYQVDLSKDFKIDSAVWGNLSRYFNHSCDPNCGYWRRERLVFDKNGKNPLVEDRIEFRTIKKIDGNDELTVPYGFDIKDLSLPNCTCGSPNCTGKLSFVGKKDVPMVYPDAIHPPTPKGKDNKKEGDERADIRKCRRKVEKNQNQDVLDVIELKKKLLALMSSKSSKPSTSEKSFVPTQLAIPQALLPTYQSVFDPAANTLIIETVEVAEDDFNVDEENDNGNGNSFQSDDLSKVSDVLSSFPLTLLTIPPLLLLTYQTIFKKAASSVLSKTVDILEEDFLNPAPSNEKKEDDDRTMSLEARGTHLSPNRNVAQWEVGMDIQSTSDGPVVPPALSCPQTLTEQFNFLANEQIVSSAFDPAAPYASLFQYTPSHSMRAARLPPLSHNTFNFTSIEDLARHVVERTSSHNGPDED